jgi:hypothetical protein
VCEEGALLTPASLVSEHVLSRISCLKSPFSRTITRIALSPSKLQRSCLKAVCQLAISAESSGVMASPASQARDAATEISPLAISSGGGRVWEPAQPSGPRQWGASGGAAPASEPAGGSVNTGAITALISVMHTGDIADAMGGGGDGASAPAASPVGLHRSSSSSVAGAAGDAGAEAAGAGAGTGSSGSGDDGIGPGLAARDVLTELLGAGGRDLSAWLHTLPPSELVVHPHAHLLWPIVAPAILRFTGAVSRVEISSGEGGDSGAASTPLPVLSAPSGAAAAAAASAKQPVAGGGYGVATSLSRALIAAGTLRDRSSLPFLAQLSALATAGPGFFHGAEMGGSTLLLGLPQHLASAAMLTAATDALPSGRRGSTVEAALSAAVPRVGLSVGGMPTSLDLNRLLELQVWRVTWGGGGEEARDGCMC